MAKGRGPGGPPVKKVAGKLYHAIVQQARQPGFYTNLGVPDTADGRFDMIALHAFLLLRRLKRDHGTTGAVAQAVFDTMFADMEHNLREMGVGDLAVGGRVKAMATGFYGRIAAYDAGLDAGEAAALGAPLRRNLYRGIEPHADHVAAMARYMCREDAALAEQSTERLMDGEADFGPAPGGEIKAPGGKIKAPGGEAVAPGEAPGEAKGAGETAGAGPS